MATRQEATQIVREAAGLAEPDFGEVLQGSEKGFIFGPPNRHRVKVREAGIHDVSLRDSVFLLDTSGGDVTLRLQSAAKSVWRIYTFKKLVVAGTVTVTPRGSEIIDNAASLVLSDQYEVERIISDGSNWWKL